MQHRIWVLNTRRTSSAVARHRARQASLCSTCAPAESMTTVMWSSLCLSGTLSGSACGRSAADGLGRQRNRLVAYRKGTHVLCASVSK